MILESVVHQPVENKDYDFDVTPLFNGDETDSLSNVAAVSVPAGLTLNAVVVDNSTAKVWVGGGDAGETYLVNITFTSTNGRIQQDELVVAVEEI